MTKSHYKIDAGERMKLYSTTFTQVDGQWVRRHEIDGNVTEFAINGVNPYHLMEIPANVEYVRVAAAAH